MTETKPQYENRPIVYIAGAHIESLRPPLYDLPGPLDDHHGAHVIANRDGDVLVLEPCHGVPWPVVVPVGAVWTAGA